MVCRLWYIGFQKPFKCMFVLEIIHMNMASMLYRDCSKCCRDEPARKDSSGEEVNKSRQLL